MIGRGAGLLMLFAAGTVSAAACGEGTEERGRQLYAQHGCAVCHGAQGRGDGPSAKRLDSPPRDFGDAASYRQGSSVSDLAASIRNGTGAMPAFRNIRATRPKTLPRGSYRFSGDPQDRRHSRDGPPEGRIEDLAALCHDRPCPSGGMSAASGSGKRPRGVAARVRR